MTKISDSLVGKAVIAWLCTPLPTSYFDNMRELQVPVESISGKVVVEKESGLLIEINAVGSTLINLQKVPPQHIFLPFHKIDSIQLRDKA
ncbi:MAG TPA: hypothetical protein PKC21_07865 [Oligoflexia bacterium]|nr:hypothetical protein [Oligoflexia bacterium]HMR25253.1 hypothetical protein [Oligoflexia bacterium]